MDIIKWQDLSREFEEKEEIVRKIIKEVKKYGDRAVVKYCRIFDDKKITEETLKVSREEIEEAKKIISPDFFSAFKKAEKNIRNYHLKEYKFIKKFWQIKKDGEILGKRVVPIEKVAFYIPGGLASYPSTVLMTVIPAQVAQVKEFFLTTPSRDGKCSPYVLFAGDYLGIKDIYKIGGAQAIAAFAYGTKRIPKVDKIVGPGNIYVTIAKKIVFGETGIDSLSGPSEIVIIADESAPYKFVANDLLSQAEHSPDAKFILISDSLALCKNVKKEIKKLLENLYRKEIIKESFEKFGKIIKVKNLKEATEIVNRIAPEHLQIMTKSPFEVLKEIKNAGCIFLGNYTPVAVGDYFAGPSHVIPTNSCSRFSSPLSVEDFLKRQNFIYYSKSKLKKESKNIIKLAETEGFYQHAESIKIRDIDY
jgi:histidinol dehydrogenase